MTNIEIITGAMTLAGVTEEVDTYAGWKRRGYQVQRGQKARFKTKIWKPCKGKAGASDDVRETEEGKWMILVNASFFAKSQVALAD